MTLNNLFKISCICLICLAAITGCNNNNKFDREKWNTGDGINYPVRDNIVDDLVKNHQLKGLNYHQVIDTLGFPQRQDTLKVAYQILDNTADFSRKKPAHIKELVLYFSKDSVVTHAAIEERTNKKL